MDIGLGIWTDSEQRYYPMEVVQAGGGAIVDVFDGKRLVVYVEPGSYGLHAFFTEEQTASSDGSRVTVGASRAGYPTQAGSAESAAG